MKTTTERTASAEASSPKERRALLAVEATMLLDRALDASSVSESRVAQELGFSKEHLRHLREPDEKKAAQFRDILGLATAAPDAYRHVLSAMAERVGLSVVERVDSSKADALLEQLGASLKEDGEANAALLAKLKSPCAQARRDAIRETRESIQARQSILLALEEEEREHVAAIRPSMTARVVS